MRIIRLKPFSQRPVGRVILMPENALLVSNNSRLVINRVGVEKVIYGKLAENSSRQDALQAISLDRGEIFYHRIRGRFSRKRVFQHPLANSLEQP